MKLKLVNFNLELRVGDKQNEGIIAIIAFITNILCEKKIRLNIKHHQILVKNKCEIDSVMACYID